MMVIGSTCTPKNTQHNVAFWAVFRGVGLSVHTFFGVLVLLRTRGSKISMASGTFFLNIEASGIV